ncbi:MAG TPA: hypothetical protein VJX69_11985 [Terriglobales bacterium]|nr:hypothetical protein [Terriglobales bacterium]
MKKNIFAVVLLGLTLSLILTMITAVAWAENAPQMPRIFANARFVYVVAYDGDQFNPNLLPEDREAISRVQDSIQKWGKLTVVYRPQDADVMVLVQSRPSEDVLAVYDAHGGDASSRPSQTYLWRVMGRGGLQKGEMPLVSEFEKAFDKIKH